ncbi:MAG: Amidohydrolase [Syntrophaceae bacterium PtaB.Bin095]|nr:MAG: Amidohydrolase [Syntrophaceae bacterium PtaB.Bin095]
MSVTIIDSHMHCGVQNVSLPWEEVQGRLQEGGIQGACLFAPVEDIYDRYDYHFVDTSAWVACRRRANRYLLDRQEREPNLIAYYFVWNDFQKEELGKGYRGIKWHCHEYEPVYNYADPRCEEFLREAYRLGLAILLEESFENTLYFLRRVRGRTPIIIPHLGMLNGGFQALLRAGVWDDGTVYADTALASSGEMAQFLERYGSERLLFGSDFPFGNPRHELLKVRNLGLCEEDFENVVSRNVIRLTTLQPPQ